MNSCRKKSKLNPQLTLVDLLGGESIVTKPIRSDFDIISLSNKGITKASLDALIRHLGISKKTFSENILDVSVVKHSSEKEAPTD